MSKKPHFWQNAVKNLRLIFEAMNVGRVGLAGMVTEHILAELFLCYYYEWIAGRHFSEPFFPLKVIIYKSRFELSPLVEPTIFKFGPAHKNTFRIILAIHKIRIVLKNGLQKWSIKYTSHGL